MEKAGDSVTAGGDGKEEILKGNVEFYDNRNYKEAAQFYKGIVDSDPKNVSARVNLGFLYSEYLFNPGESLKLSREVTMLQPDSESRSNLIEALIRAGLYEKEAQKHALYEEARKYAQEVIKTGEGDDNKGGRSPDFLNKHTLDHSGYQILNRFFVLCSYMLEGDNDKSNEALKEFIRYYRRLGKDFRIRDEQWIFNGLVKAVAESNASPIAKFLLYSLIDLLEGRKIDRGNLAIQHILSHPLSLSPSNI
jgi:tetratricopeptide (TPR) repeat protein